MLKRTDGEIGGNRWANIFGKCQLTKKFNSQVSMLKQMFLVWTQMLKRTDGEIGGNRWADIFGKWQLAKKFNLEVWVLKQMFLVWTQMLKRTDGEIGGNRWADIFGKRLDIFLAQFSFHAQDLFSMNLLLF